MEISENTVLLNYNTGSSKWKEILKMQKKKNTMNLGVTKKLNILTMSFSVIIIAYVKKENYIEKPMATSVYLFC